MTVHFGRNYAGGRDFWIVRIDSTGEIVWQRTFGGTQDEIAFLEKFEGFIMSAFIFIL